MSYLANEKESRTKGDFMSVQVLMGLLGPDEVKRLSDVDVEVLSSALVRAIDADPAAKARLLAVVQDERQRLAGPALTAAG